MFIETINDKRLTVANESISKLSECFRHLFKVTGSVAVDETFQKTIASTYNSLINQFEMNFPEELITRIINQFVHIYLQYILPADLEGTLKNEPMKGSFSTLANALTRTKPQDPSKANIYHEIVGENLRNLLMVAKSETQEQNIDLGQIIKNTDLELAKSDIFKQIFDKDALQTKNNANIVASTAVPIIPDT